MSNCKQVSIQGIAPFNLHEHEPITPMLASLVSPTCGLKMEWDWNYCELSPNEHGGQTAMYRFRLHGVEAVNFAWLAKFKREIVACGGSISEDKTYDMEG